MTDPTDGDSQLLFRRARAADRDAQQDLHDRYATRLAALVRSRLQRELRSRFDAEEVVNSAFRSFFIALAGDRFSWPTQGGLWPLLAQITLHKLHRATRHHQRLRRAAASEVRWNGEAISGVDDQHLAEAALRDELEFLMSKLPAVAAVALQRSIEGYSQQEIAAQLRCTPRTVRRYVAEARVLLRARLSLAVEAGGGVGDTRRWRAVGTDDLMFEDYLLRRMIGAGVFGKVYLATDRTTGDDVAVKYLRKRWNKDAQVVRRFIDETRLLQRLEIDGVVPCYGGGQIAGGGRFFVMKWIAGETLADRIARGALGEQEVRSQFAPLANCLQQIHAAGIIHCDLKPTNILIDQSDRWWLTDFGFARCASTSSVALSGTPAYMAPEQRDPFFGPLGPWTDLYAVGKVILASITGEAVSESETWATQPTPAHGVQKIAGRISPELNVTLQRLLQRRTGDRLASAGELARLLLAG